MGDRFQKRCNEPGCPERTSESSGYCPKHLTDNTRKRQRAVFDKARHSTTESRMYNVVWDRLKTMVWNRGNEICQRIVDGKQCRTPVEIFHHLISPRENSRLMYDWRNIVGVCRQHHPPTEGE